MKLIRYRQDGKVKPGVFQNEKYLSVAGFFEDYNEVFFANDGLKRLSEILRDKIDKLPGIPGTISLDAPVARPSKIVCIGLNYADHARETNATPPTEPVLFMKSTTALCGPNDDVIIPRGSVKTDWEVELAVVIGKRASYVEEADAMNYVAGYALHNDYSEREFQIERQGTWDKGKGCDTFAPLGPWMATPDEIDSPDILHLWLKVNGKMMQDGNTANFLFKIPHLIAYTSRFMTLLPGDVISTGTPAGVALGMKTHPYLRPGDVVELGIDGLGVSRQHLVAWRPE